MNRLFVVVLCRFSILVHVGPARRGAPNKYLGDEDIFQKFVPVFLRPGFSRAREKPGRINEHGFFRCSLRFLVKEKQARVFRHEQFFGPCFSLVNAPVKNGPKA